MTLNTEDLDVSFGLKLSVAAQQWQADSPTVFTRDRSKSVGASEAFNCPRALYLVKKDIAAQNANKNDTPPLMPDGGFMLRGKIMEDAYIAHVLKKLYGDNIRCVGDDQQTFVSPDTEHLTATPDGIVRNDDGSEFLIEIKTIDPRARLHSPKVNHVLQTHIQMGVTGVKTHTKLVYFNASDYFHVTAFHINYDAGVYEAAVERAKEVMQAASADEIDVSAELIMGTCASCKFNVDSRCIK